MLLCVEFHREQVSSVVCRLAGGAVLYRESKKSIGLKLQNLSGWKSKIYRVDIVKSIGLGYNMVVKK